MSLYYIEKIKVDMIIYIKKLYLLLNFIKLTKIPFFVTHNLDIIY